MERSRPLVCRYCPNLSIGGVCHGTDEQKVDRDLLFIVAAEIAESARNRRALPKKSSLVTIPVTA